MMKKLTMLTVGLMLACFCVAFSGVSMAEAKTITLKFSTAFPPRHTMQVQVFEPWAEKIEKLTDGRVKVEFYPGGALGKAPDQYELAEKGLADLIYTLHDYHPGRFPLTTVFELPFMVPSATQTSRAMWKLYEENEAFREEYDKVKVLALFCHPGGDFHTVKKPIRALEDLKGMKIRTANPSVTEALKLYGAVPVTIPVTEAYTALERGVVDGTVVPWEGLGIFNMDEVTKYATILDFYTMTMTVVMNKRKWESLPEDIKEIIDEHSGMALSLKAGEVYDDTDEPFRQRALKKGVEEIIPPEEEREKFQEAIMPLREQWVEKMEGKGLPGREVLDAAEKYIQEDVD